MIYKFREGYSLPIKAQIVGERLAEIQARHGETFGCDDVLEDARPEDSPLHGCFEWDDTEAAEKYRLDQARKIIRSIEVVVITESKAERKGPAYVHIPQATSAYMRTETAMADTDRSAQVIAEAKAQLAGWNRRYRFLAAVAKEFGPVVEAIDNLIEPPQIEKPTDGNQAEVERQRGNGGRRKQDRQVAGARL
jgi:hypothetical protein